MKILITGGAGYVGSVLVPLLLQVQHEVVVLDNMTHKENTLASSCLDANFEFYNVDVRSRSAVGPHLPQADVVILLADLVGAPICDRNPVDALLVNRDAKLSIINELSDHQ